HEYEMFTMNENEDIKSMFSRFTNIINALQALDKTYSNSEMVRKILRCLPRSWMPKVTAIEEAKNLNVLLGKMDPPTCFECNKSGHIKADCPQLRKKKFSKKKAFKAWHLSDDDSSDEEVTEQVASLCFMASSDNEESDNEVDDSYTFDELQYAFDELLIQFKKKCSQYSSLKKNVASIENEK
ncbi:zf-CCHC domain-containing protein/UBN2 domain-containing protein, partial [Cephalotus follicularis]